jgi:hypothetical protein
MRRVLVAVVVCWASACSAAHARPVVLVGWEDGVPGHESGPAPIRVTALNPASGARRTIFSCDLVSPAQPGCFATSPVGSPDGRTIDFRDGPFGDEWTMAADGSGAHRLPLPSGASYLGFSPGGGQIAFTTSAGLYVSAADGSGLRLLAPTPPTDRLHDLRNPSWATRGRIAYLRYRGPNVSDGLPYHAWITTTAGGPGRLAMRRDVIDYALSLDGRQAAWSNHRGVWVGTPSGRHARLVARDPDVTRLAWRRDGGAIAYLSNVEDVYGEADVTIVELRPRPRRRAYRFMFGVSPPSWLG